MSDNRPAGYTEGDNTIYRASSIGSCLTSLVAARLEYQKARPEYQEKILMTAAGEGNLQEPHIVETLKTEHGWRVWGSQDSIEVKVIPRVYLRGHTDGACRPKGARKDRGLEIKTMSESRFKKWKASGKTVRAKLMTEEFETYGWQVSSYMHANQMPYMYVVKNRNSGELYIEELTVPTVEWRDIKKKIIEVEMWVKRGELPPCNASSGTKFFCPYPYLHDLDNFPEDEPEDDETVYDSATDALISGMAEHYSDLARQVSKLKPLDDERRDVGRNLIEAIPGSDDYTTADGWQVKQVPNNRNETDWDKVAKAFGVDRETFDEQVKKFTKSVTKSYYPRIRKAEK